MFLALFRRAADAGCVSAAYSSETRSSGMNGTCGDGVCDPTAENAMHCLADCGGGFPTFGNGACDLGESNMTCMQDCPF